jgi:hypothetical protein
MVEQWTICRRFCKLYETRQVRGHRRRFDITPHPLDLLRRMYASLVIPAKLKNRKRVPTRVLGLRT